jgi:quercetin dioxygenase-like cupin family protein
MFLLQTKRCRICTFWLTAAAALLIAPGGVLAEAHHDEDHVLLRADDIGWGPGPDYIPEGAEVAVLYGDPGAEGVFAARFRFPEGYELAPHIHNQPEIVTVISGTYNIGTGYEFDRDATEALEAGEFYAFPPGTPHFAYVEEETIIQLNSPGPYLIEYPNPDDDPRNQ